MKKEKESQQSNTLHRLPILTIQVIPTSQINAISIIPTARIYIRGSHAELHPSCDK